jgi:Cu(I)/Ag(I) efflux system membrane fusion protein
MKTSFNYKKITKITGILLLGLFLGWLFFGGSAADQPVNMDQHVQEAHTDEQGNIVYTCSMHPGVRQNEPGDCPICGMELIEAGNSGGMQEENPYELTMTLAAMRLAEVQTTEINQGKATKTVRMPGKIAVDESRTSSITALFPGRIEDLYVDFTGQYVSSGEPLASIYSPKLVTAQKELIEAAKYKESNPTIYNAAKRKLKLWELSDRQIQQIEQSGEIQNEMNIVAAKSGYVMAREVSREDYVQEGTMMYKIADLSRLWVMFQAYENDLAGLDKGDEVQFTVGAYPGETFNARITYIDPVLNAVKRTVSVRAEVHNPENRLKPEMLAEGVVSSTLDKGNDQLLVPKSAVLWTGERSVVYIRKPGTEQPTFEFRQVVLGPRVGEQYVVKSGLEPGEEVVTNGNFKIDSAAQLAGKASMMNQNPEGAKQSGMPEMNIKGSDSKMEMQESSQKMVPVNSDTLDKKAVPEAFKKQLDELAEKYFAVSSALSNDKMQEASSAMDLFEETLADIDMGLIKDDKQMKAWMNYVEALEKQANAIQESSEMASFRTQFAMLSETLAETLTTFGMERALFVQFCPMARGGDGAYWVSKKEEIENPYMGQNMLKCGETKKELNRK